jgi:4-nitrophenyl phosphatase
MRSKQTQEFHTKSIRSGERKALILDMDGVLWRENQPIGDLPQIFGRIQENYWKVCLATNNATLSAEQYLEKLASFGVILTIEQIVNSAQAAAHYLSKKHPEGGHVYVIGENGLIEALTDGGFICVELTPEEANAKYGQILAVVAGMDRMLTYHKLTVATRLIRSGVEFIATNPDRTFPTPIGLVPGAGAILAAIEAATDVRPLICGKPSPEMYRFALERMGVEPQNTIVVGDRLETDIAGGQALGCLTALVLSGVTSPETAHSWTPAPDWIIPDLDTLLKQIT